MNRDRQVARPGGWLDWVAKTSSPIRKAVVTDRHNPIAVITLSPTLLRFREKSEYRNESPCHVSRSQPFLRFA